MERILFQGKELLPPKSDLVFKALFGMEGGKEPLHVEVQLTDDDNIIQRTLGYNAALIASQIERVRVRSFRPFK